MRLTRNAKVGQTPAQRGAVRGSARRRPDAGLSLGVAGRRVLRRDAAAAVRRRRGGRRPPAPRRPPSAGATRAVVMDTARLTRPAAAPEQTRSFAELYAAEMGATARVRDGWRDQASPGQCAIPAARCLHDLREAARDAAAA